MKIITDETLKVYYYTDLNDLMLNEVEFNELGISLNDWKDSPCRICPRGDKMLYILLLNTGDRKEDLKTLKHCIKKVFPELTFTKEL